MDVLVTTDFREPLQKGGEGVGGDRDEPESGNLKDLDTLSYRSRANGNLSCFIYVH